ncbi:MAG: hypothetical protein A2Y60_06075 [Chloroflexi bacterium RBG_13_54_9]|nr:MAG: hypothetical protein A2Y60_06075 [Chloroflexi bacterium RBG_13_54_9]
MQAFYGYDDASGAYFITIDTEKCDGCGLCVTACRENVLEVAEDDYGKAVAKVKDDVVSRVGYVCPGFEQGCSKRETSCHSVCHRKAISHTW